MNFNPALLLPFPIFIFFIFTTLCSIFFNLFVEMMGNAGGVNTSWFLYANPCLLLFSSAAPYLLLLSDLVCHPWTIVLQGCPCLSVGWQNSQSPFRTISPPTWSTTFHESISNCALKMFLSTPLPHNFSKCVSSHFSSCVSLLCVVLCPFPHLLLLPALCVTCISF